MSEVFADAGYWIAIQNVDDELHNAAQKAIDELRQSRIVTTQMALVEFLNHMSRLGQHRRTIAVNTVRGLKNNPSVEIVQQTGEQFYAAVERYASRPDQRWSATDCASFLLMEERGITEALAYDRDFEQAGFTALLRDADNPARQRKVQ